LAFLLVQEAVRDGSAGGGDLHAASPLPEPRRSLAQWNRAHIPRREEKGIDVRIALDVIRLATHDRFDVGMIFSQDQDFSEMAEEIRAIAREHDRWIKIVCAFPSSPTSRQTRGIQKTDWIRLDRATYESCLDRRDYT
jgi:hypothetical protein